MALNKSSWYPSRVTPIRDSASLLVRFLIPCSDLKWNLHQNRSPLSFQSENVCDPYPFMCIGVAGMPLSDIRIVVWCKLSGDSDQKSHIAVGDRRLVFGCLFCDRMKSGNFHASRTKNTGVLFATMSQLPSSV
eukprot:gene4-biopygen3